METSKKVMEEMGVHPKLRLSVKSGNGVISTGPHRVKIMKDKPVKMQKEGKEVDGIRYLFEEKGVLKTYERAIKNKEGKLDYFVERMAELTEGDELMLESKRIGIKNYIEIIPLSGNHSGEVEDEDIIQLDENT